MSKSNGTPLPPNTTLYVKNFPNKINKVELRRQLYSLFVGYGKILDIVATKIDGMKGQAFVVFRDLASSTAALRALDGFIFYDKPLSIDYAQSRSKASIVAERGPEALFDPDLLESAKGSNRKKITFSSAGAELRGRERKRAREEAGVKVAQSDDGSGGEEEEEIKEGGEAGRRGKRQDDDEEEDAKPELKKAKIDKGPEEDEEEEMEMADSDED